MVAEGQRYCQICLCRSLRDRSIADPFGHCRRARDYPICLLSVLRNPGKGQVAIAPLSVEPIGIALPARDPLLVDLVQNYLGAMEASGFLDRLKERWLQHPSWLKQLP